MFCQPEVVQLRVMLTCHVRFASALAWYAFHLARGLRAAGHEVWLSAQRGSPLAEWAAAENIPGTSRFDYHSANPIQIAAALADLRRVMRDFKPDILNPHCPPGHSFLALAGTNGVPLVRTAAEPRSPKSNWANRFLHERRTAGMIYSTESSRKRYEQAFNFERTAQAVIYPGLDLGKFPSVASENWRQRLGIRDDQLFAAVVARMSPEKGQEVLIEALARMDDASRARIVVLMTGDDNRQRTWHDIEKLAAANSVLDSVRFAPRLHDVRPLMTEIDLGIITSVRSEAVCRVALEYMAYSIPVISSDVNILPEVVRERVNGWIFPNRDSARLATLLEEVVTHRDQAAEFGYSGRKLLESEFTLQRMTDTTVAFYSEVIAQHA